MDKLSTEGLTPSVPSEALTELQQGRSPPLWLRLCSSSGPPQKMSILPISLDPGRALSEVNKGQPYDLPPSQVCDLHTKRVVWFNVGTMSAADFAKHAGNRVDPEPT